MMRRALLYASRSTRLAALATASPLAWAVAKRFVAGTTLSEGVAVARRLNAGGLAVTLDHLGENVTSRAEAEASRDACLAAVSGIREAGIHSGISVKLTSLGLGITEGLAAEMLSDILRHAAAERPPVFVRIDMEDSSRVDATLSIFRDLFPSYRNAGVVIQSYLYRSDDDLEQLIAAGAGIRLVKGAYLEPAEVAYPAKSDVDRAFARQCERLLAPDALAAGVYSAVATHDTRLIEHVKAHAERQGVGRDRFEFQMLLGVRRDLQADLAKQGYRVRTYVPYGTHWFPYFTRRLAERPQNVMFLLSNLVAEVLPGRERP